MSILKLDYLGRKGSSGLYQFIINKIPKHDVFIDAFMGTGFISSMKRKASLNYGIEIDGALQTELSMLEISSSILHGNVFDELLPLLNMSMLQGRKICIYLDPPYLPETRTCFDKCQYDNELTREEHIKLLSMLEQISKDYPNVYILLSGYKSDLYMTMLDQWNYFETNCMSRGGVRTESLWCNFNPDNFEKHQLDYVGHNFTDRQRIQRKRDRWINNLKNMSGDERQYILESIKKEFSTP